MGFTRHTQKAVEKPGMNPTWRGIGCILMVIVPLVTYALTAILVPWIAATGMMPRELSGHVRFPDWAYKTPTISSMANYLSNVDYLWVKVIGFLVIFTLLTGVFSLLYSAIYQVVGPPRYTNVDAPPSKHKTKVYKR